MRHQKNRHKMGRAKGHRKRTLQALSNALIDKKRVQTTVTKAKALRPFVEPLITRAKEDTTHNRRQVFRHLQDKEAVRELFNEVAVEVGDRTGGYTRVIKLGRRTGDGAERAMIELVDYNDVQPKTGSTRRRTRRGGSGGRTQRPDASQQQEQQEEPTGAQEDAPAQDEGEAAGGPPSSQGRPEAATTETADQQESLAGVEAEPVETPVPEEQKEPVPDRTQDEDEAVGERRAEAAEEGAAEEGAAEEGAAEEGAAEEEKEEDEK